MTHILLQLIKETRYQDYLPPFVFAVANGLHSCRYISSFFVLFWLRSEEEESLHKEIKSTERRMQQAKYRANDRLLKFGDWMPRVVNAINTAVREGRFTKPPRGPIGKI